MIYSIFALDLGIKLYLAPSVKEHVKAHWLDVLIVALPLLRPLRIIQSARFLRLVRLIRVVTFATEGLRKFMSSLKNRSFHIIASIVLAWAFASAILVTIFERNAGGDIHNFILQLG